ncbi:type III-A CRISPR-associated RAMP protein Csm5 [Oceanicella actignis]|uniref:CRISPR system Cms protein Csm5 n=1 Tax=Oceanicella actignis TaxID=1189325 RepID=A0A1M7S201_9RHOB|nr:type III-A CRISPR-associated RAMP protein Csm5 [Oceanicella actignis]SES91508.1 CRISPR type III-A/MTUBE-associated RAMP protein Csm5 [Oceanicella actignis]SHN52405.1 CRISPR type III-A/MTUBE-associated RAMP protein Csm5 [Oceanicella actignis]
MTSVQFATHEFVLVPLTPIHVGGGEEARLLPEDYRLSKDRAFVERVAARAVLARLDARMRTDLIAKFDRDPQGLIRSLQERARDDEILERIPIGQDSARNVDLRRDGHGRLNLINAFHRSGGRPIVPGSSLKGALRTAWLRHLWDRKKQQARGRDPWQIPHLESWAAMPPRGKDSRAACAKELERTLLDLAKGKDETDADPFRDVFVGDVRVPVDGTRIDKVGDWKKARDGYRLDDKKQMHYERLRSVMDGGEPPIMRVALGLRAEQVRRRRAHLDAEAKRSPRSEIASVARLLEALEVHHGELWRRELEKYFGGPEGRRLHDCLKLFDAFDRGGENPEAALLRIGWAAHAEAKSLAPVRRVERPQAKGSGRFAEEGSTRHVIDLSGHPAPFGWALLVRADAWARKAPDRYLSPPVHRPNPSISAGAGHGSKQAGRRDTALGSQLLHAKGARILVGGEEAILAEDVTRAHKPSDQVLVDFGDGPEPIRVDQIDGDA